MNTNNGLENKEFQDIRNSLLKDAEQILGICNSKNGHLGDVVSGIKTIISSMDLKAKKLWEIFEEQKSNQKLNHENTN